jgi:hypothetical protein
MVAWAERALLRRRAANQKFWLAALRCFDTNEEKAVAFFPWKAVSGFHTRGLFLSMKC